MTAYSGYHAELYDLFYKDKSYDKESTFIDSCLKKYTKIKPKSLLEIACGTGSHAFCLENHGYRITASDYSSDMIQIAANKKKKIGSKIKFNITDMRSIPDYVKKFDAAICLFDAIGYVISNDGISKVLSGIHKNIIDNGLFVFEFWHAPTMIKYYEPVRIRRFLTVDSEIIRISETELDKKSCTARVKYTIITLKKDGSYGLITEIQKNRYFTVSEMEKILMKNNFKPIHFFAGYSEIREIDDQVWHIIVVARKIVQ